MFNLTADSEPVDMDQLEIIDGTEETVIEDDDDDDDDDDDIDDEDEDEEEVEEVVKEIK